MGIFDLFRRKPAPAGGAAEKPWTPPPPRAEVLKKYGANFPALRALADAEGLDDLELGHEGFLSWAQGTRPSRRGGPVVETIRLTIVAGEAVLLKYGIAGLEVLMRSTGVTLEEAEGSLMHYASSGAMGWVLRDEAHIEELFDPAVYDGNALGPGLRGRFHPPQLDAERLVFFVCDREHITRVEVHQSGAVKSEFVSPAPQRKQSPRGPNFKEPMMPGRHHVDAQGQLVVAPWLGAAGGGLAQQLRAQGAVEHASIASFARSVQELMAAGAPLGLVERTLQAALDEVRHTRECMQLAAALDGAEVAPGPLPLLPPRRLDRAGIASTTLAEAAGPEAEAVHALQRSADGAPPPVAAALRAQAEDEARHAQLALDVIAWATGSGPS